MAGLFACGLLYTLIAVAQGRWTDPAVLIAVIIETMLVYASWVEEPITKKGISQLVLATILYISYAVLLNILTEVAVMAAGGMLLFAALHVEPKFPMTKRAILTGIVVGVIMTFLGIYLALKLGIIYFVGAEMLGALILGVFGKYTAEENTVVVAIANSSSMIAIGVLIVFPAIDIFILDDLIVNSIITYPFIVFVTGVSAICGMLILAPMRDRFEDEPWPQVRPQAECIIAIGADETAKKDVLTGLGASMAWVGATRVAEAAIPGTSLSSVPHAIAPAVFPDWVGVSNSPLMAAMGFFMGWKRVLVLVTGSVVSLLIWVLLEGANPLLEFGTHLQRPEILYLALGVFASVIAGDVLSGRRHEKDELSPTEFEDISNKDDESDPNGFMIGHPHKASDVPRLARIPKEVFDWEEIKREIREMVENPREYLKSRRGQLPLWVAFVSLGIFMTITLLVFWIFTPFGGLQIHFGLIILGSPIVLASAYFTARAISETGMLAGYISDIIAIPAILLFRVGFATITVFMSMLGALQDSAIALLVHLKLGRLTGVRGRDIAKAVFIGAILGTFVGSAITYVIFITYGFGGTDFPSPAAQLFGFLVISLQGLGDLTLPGMRIWPEVSPFIVFVYLFSFGVGGYLAGRELHKKGMSAISLAVGLLIPPATAVAMLFGGFVDYRLKKKRGESEEEESQAGFLDPLRDKTTRLLSGVVAGEAIVTVVWVLFSAIVFLGIL